VVTSQASLFGNANDSPWTETTAVRQYPLWFTQYPFRTGNFRELHLARQLTGDSGGDFSSPLIPAHAQFSLIFKRDTDDFLNKMLIEKLSPRLGSTVNRLTQGERDLALKIGGADKAPQPTDEVVITGIDILLKAVKLQVYRETVHLFPPPLSPLTPRFYLSCLGVAHQIQTFFTGTSTEQCIFIKLDRYYRSSKNYLAAY